jgi:hypothetical protein
MRTTILISAIALTAAAPAGDATLGLARGQSVTVQVTSGGVTAAKPMPAKIAPFEQAAANMQAPGEVPSITADRIKFKLVEYAAGQTVLAVENGYARGLAYHAVLHRGAETQSTMVCLVKPGMRAMERWPFAVDRVELSDLHLVDWKQGDPAPCQ